MISNAQSNEEYADGVDTQKHISFDSQGDHRSLLLLKVSSTILDLKFSNLFLLLVSVCYVDFLVTIVRPKVVESMVGELPPPGSLLVGDSSINKYPEEYEWDEFGNDLYAIPETNLSQTSNFVVNVPPGNKVDGDSKIKALIDTPALYWNHCIVHCAKR